MQAASLFDGFSFDLFPPFENGLTASEVDVSRRQVVQALVVSTVCCSRTLTWFKPDPCSATCNVSDTSVADMDLSQGLLELARLSLELLDLVRGRLTCRVAGEPFLTRLQELFRPTVVEVLIDPFLAAQFSNAVLAAQAFQHNADLLFSGMMPACGSANIPDRLFSAVRYALARLSHRCSSTGLR